MKAVSRGTLLDGRVVYDQFLTGYRTGIEPVLLAASVPARPGERVLEAGTGAGAGLLCLAARVAGVVGIGVEQDADLAALGQANAAANGFGAVSIAAGDVLAMESGSPVDHAMANPPWHPAGGTRSEDGLRDSAKRGRPGLVHDWTAALAARLRHRGTLTLIVPARATTEALAALAAAQCGSQALLPLWPGVGREARIVLVQAIRDGRAGCRVLPGLMLHGEDGAFTPAAEAILRGGAALPFESGPVA
ncbi:MAG: methyltransferase [Acetobacteraceae bacterium]